MRALLNTPRRRRVAALLAAVAMAVVLFPSAVPRYVGDPEARYDRIGLLAENAGLTSSAMTVAGSGDFSDLKVTVGQTKDLVNQSVAVSWAWGGDDPASHATIRQGTDPAANYLSIMQCWGDGSPDRTQCEYGGRSSLAAAGNDFSTTRRIFSPKLAEGPLVPRDPKEAAVENDKDYFVQDDPSRLAVPFRTVGNEFFTHKGNAINPYYGEFDTNEIAYGVTRGDGKGFETFEAQSFRESAGLGCADIIASGTLKGTPRSCWLVVVPRAKTEVDGRDVSQMPAQRLISSPLSASNWANRIVVPLHFQAIGQPCPISAQQRLVGGVETSAEAVLRWQPKLCTNGGAVYGFSKLPDAVSELPLTGNGSTTRGLSFLNAPVDASEVPADRTLVYAPMAISGITIGALVERNPVAGASDEEQRSRGERIEDISLTPRLVAKLLTQSYQAGIAPDAPAYIKGNPVNVTKDPEFLALNPTFKEQAADDLALMEPTGVSYTVRMLWEYVESDQDARDFVAGLPDKWGMKVNPFYQGLSIPSDTLPKIDPYCRRDSGPYSFPQLCAFDLHPAVADFHEAARQVSRGDSLSLTWPNFAGTPDPTASLTTRVARQVPGARRILGVTDTATAARYQLSTVKLRNGAGQFVAPTTASLQAGAAAMKATSVPGVKVANVATTAKNAYPLTTVTYAVSAPNQLTADAAKDYATFVRYAAGTGQTPGTAAGTLPDGYAPLSAGLRAEARAAADQIQARIGPKATTPPPSGDSGGGSKGGGSKGSGSGGGASAGGVTPVATPSATATATPTTPPTQVATEPAAARTPADAVVGWIARYGFLLALVLGLAGLIATRLLPRISRRMGRS